MLKYVTIFYRGSTPSIIFSKIQIRIKIHSLAIRKWICMRLRKVWIDGIYY